MSLDMLRKELHPPTRSPASHSPHIWTGRFKAQLHLTRYMKSDSGFGSGLSMDYGTMYTLQAAGVTLPHFTPIAKTMPAGPYSDLRGFFPKFLL